MVDAVAIDEPQTEEKSALAPMVAIAIPPRSRPKRAFTKVKRSLPSLALARKSPIKMNSGITLNA